MHLGFETDTKEILMCKVLEVIFQVESTKSPTPDVEDTRWKSSSVRSLIIHSSIPACASRLSRAHYGG